MQYASFLDVLDEAEQLPLPVHLRGDTCVGAQDSRGRLGSIEGTIKRARKAASAAKLDINTWPSIERVAPGVERWRYAETLDYVKKIRANKDALSPR